MKYLSIIIPIYNMEVYLPECLASLQRQSFGEEVEILLLDDGSFDSSGIICDKIAAEDSHFRVFHQMNRGVAATRNHGLAEAQGKYIAWVDPDDYVTDDWWQVLQVELAKDPDMIFFDMKRLEHGKLIEQYFDDKSRVITRQELFDELAKDCIPSHCWSKIIKKKFFEGNNFDEKLSLFEDFQAMHHITFRVNECVYLHKCLYIYRQHANSIVHDKSNPLSSSWLELKLCRERFQFYTSKQIKVSNIGCLYYELLFCLSCCRESKPLTIDMQKRYHECVWHLKSNRRTLLKGKKISFKQKVYLVWIVYDLIFLYQFVLIVKKILGRN